MAFEFSQAGIDEKLAVLYSSPEDQIEQEAAFVTENFAKWVSDNFALDEEQLKFLYGITDQEWLYTVGQQTGRALTQRLPIILNRYPNTDPPGAKYIMTTQRVSDLLFEIGYRM